MPAIRNTPAFRIERESRLLRFANIEVPQSQAAEQVQNSKDRKTNAALKGAFDIYEDPHVLDRHPILRNPVDRNYFYALLLSNSLKDRTIPYKDIKRTDIDPTLPSGITPDVTDDLATGNNLGVFLPEARAGQLGAGPEARGAKYRELVESAKAKWDVAQPLEQDLVVDVTVDYYAYCRKELDAYLKASHILVPGEQKLDPGIGQSLTRDEYFKLLAFVWEKGVNGERSAGIEAFEALPQPITSDILRTEIIGKPTDDMKHAGTMYAERSFEELGPAETLKQFGIVMGPRLQSEYAKMRSGKDAIPTAQTWLSQPQDALFFLEGRMPKVEGNDNFMKALREHVADPKKTEFAGGLKEDDLRVILGLVSQSCLEVEGTFERSQMQRANMIVGPKLDSSIEKGAGDLWKFMLDIRKHPIASGALWLGALVLFNEVRSLLGKGSPRILRWAFMGALGATGYGLYQQHKTGKAWWEDLAKSTKSFMDKDSQNSPEDQTFANYWTSRLGLEDDWFSNNLPFAKKNHAEAVFATLQDQNVKTVLDWYEGARQERSKTGKLPALPDSFNGRYKKMFGEMRPQQRAELFYSVLEQFFAERGQYVLDHNMDSLYGDGAVVDRSQLGYAYMKQKYDSNVVYEVVVTQFQEVIEMRFEKETGIADISLDGTNMDPDKILALPEIAALEKDKPAVYVSLKKFLAGFRPVVVPSDTADFSMMEVMFNEADPEILRRMGRKATQAADLRAQMEKAIGFGR